MKRSEFYYLQYIKERDQRKELERQVRILKAQVRNLRKKQESEMFERRDETGKLIMTEAQLSARNAAMGSQFGNPYSEPSYVGRLERKIDHLTKLIKEMR